MLTGRLQKELIQRPFDATATQSLPILELGYRLFQFVNELGSPLAHSHIRGFTFRFKPIYVANE